MAEITLTMQLSPGFNVHIADNFNMEEPCKVKDLLTELCAILQEYGPDLALDARETMNIVSRETTNLTRTPDQVLREQARKSHEKDRQALAKAAEDREKALAARIEELIKENGMQRTMAIHMAENEFLEADRQKIAEIRGW